MEFLSIIMGKTDTPSFDENSPEAKKMLEAVTKAFEVELPEATESTQATDGYSQKTAYL